MLKALIYFYEIKGNSYEKANGGIGIIPYTYDAAYKYYFAFLLANQKNSELDIRNYEIKQEKIKRHPPKRKVNKKKKFSFLDIDNILLEETDGE